MGDLKVIRLNPPKQKSSEKRRFSKQKEIPQEQELEFNSEYDYKRYLEKQYKENIQQMAEDLKQYSTLNTQANIPQNANLEGVAENVYNKLSSAAKLLNPFQWITDTRNYLKSRQSVLELEQESPSYLDVAKNAASKQMERLGDATSFLNFISPSQWWGAAKDAQRYGFNFRRMGNSILNGNMGFLDSDKEYSWWKPLVYNGVADAFITSPELVVNLGKTGLNWLDDIAKNMTPPSAPAVATIGSDVFPTAIKTTTPQFDFSLRGINGASTIPKLVQTGEKAMYNDVTEDIITSLPEDFQNLSEAQQKEWVDQFLQNRGLYYEIEDENIWNLLKEIKRGKLRPNTNTNLIFTQKGRNGKISNPVEDAEFSRINNFFDFQEMLNQHYNYGLDFSKYPKQHYEYVPNIHSGRNHQEIPRFGDYGKERVLIRKGAGLNDFGYATGHTIWDQLPIITIEKNGRQIKTRAIIDPETGQQIDLEDIYSPILKELDKNGFTKGARAQAISKDIQTSIFETFLDNYRTNPKSVEEWTNYLDDVYNGFELVPRNQISSAVVKNERDMSGLTKTFIQTSDGKRYDIPKGSLLDYATKVHGGYWAGKNELGKTYLDLSEEGMEALRNSLKYYNGGKLIKRYIKYGK